MQYGKMFFLRFFKFFFKIVTIRIDFCTINIYIFGAKYKNIE